MRRVPPPKLRVVKHSNKQADESNKNERFSNMRNSLVSSIIQDPRQLKMLILAGTDVLLQDIHQLTECTNLQKLDLSSNLIKMLPKEIKFERLINLKLFYLHNNLIEELESLQKVFMMQSVLYLTIFSNPLASKPCVRHYIVNKIPSLLALDFNVISDEERSSLVSSTNSYFALSHNTKLSWPLVSYPQDEELSEDDYLTLLRQEIAIINQKYADNSAVVRIQRNMRRYLAIKRLSFVRDLALRQIKRMHEVIEKWKKFVRKRIILKTTFHQRRLNLPDIVTQNFKALASRARIKIAAQKQKIGALKIIQMSLNKIKNLFTQYLKVLKPEKSKKLYFRYDEQSILRTCLQYFQVHMQNSQLAGDTRYANDLQLVEKILQNFESSVKISIDFTPVRLADGFDVGKTTYPLLMFTRPALLSQVLDNRRISATLKRKVIFEDLFYTASEHPVTHKFKSKVFIKDKFKIKGSYNFERKKYTECQERLKTFQERIYLNMVELDISGFSVQGIHLLFKHILLNNLNDGKKFLQLVEREFFETQIKNKKVRMIADEDRTRGYLLVFLEQQLVQVSACLRIQKFWRARHIRKSQEAQKLLYSHVLHALLKTARDSYGLIQMQRAALHLQVWFKDLRFRHRCAFWKDMQFYARDIKSRSFALNKEVYFSLSRLSEAQAQQMRFIEQNHMILSDHVQGIARLYWHETPKDLIINVLSKLNKRLFPPWLNLVAANKDVNSQHIVKGTIMHLLHTGAQVEFLAHNGKGFIRFEYQSIDEARYRAVALALHSYRFTQNSAYISTFAVSELKNCESQKFVAYEIKLWNVYGIEVLQDTARLNIVANTHIENKQSMFLRRQSTPHYFVQHFSRFARTENVKAVHMYKKNKNTEKVKKREEILFICLHPSLYLFQALRAGNQYLAEKTEASVMTNVVIRNGQQQHTKSSDDVSKSLLLSKAGGIEQRSSRRVVRAMSKNHSRNNRSSDLTINSIGNKYTPCTNQLNKDTRAELPPSGYQQKQSNSKSDNRLAPLRQDHSYNIVFTEGDELESEEMGSRFALLSPHQRNLDREQITAIVEQREAQEIEEKRSIVEQARQRALVIRDLKKTERLLALENHKANFLHERDRLVNQSKIEREEELNYKIERVNQLKRIVETQKRYGNFVQRVRTVSGGASEENEFIASIMKGQNYLAKQQQIYQNKKSKMHQEQKNYARAQKIRDARAAHSFTLLRSKSPTLQQLDQQNVLSNTQAEVTNTSSAKKGFSNNHLQTIYDRGLQVLPVQAIQMSLPAMDVVAQRRIVASNSQDNHHEEAAVGQSTIDAEKQMALRVSADLSASQTNDLILPAATTGKEQAQTRTPVASGRIIPRKQIPVGIPSRRAVTVENLQKNSIELKRPESTIASAAIQQSNQKRTFRSISRNKVQKLSNNIIHAVFPEEFYPIGNHEIGERQFL